MNDYVALASGHISCAVAGEQAQKLVAGTKKEVRYVCVNLGQ